MKGRDVIFLKKQLFKKDIIFIAKDTNYYYIENWRMKTHGKSSNKNWYFIIHTSNRNFIFYFVMEDVRNSVLQFEDPLELLLILILWSLTLYLLFPLPEVADH